MKPPNFGGAFDVIIVGAGAAGCAAASRVSEKASLRVLLIEAGPDMPPGREPPEVRDLFPRSYCNPKFLWLGLHAELKEARGEIPAASGLFEQGRLLGGGSNLMGMSAMHGGPDDYDEWKSLGAHSWGWDDVLPYFRRLERDLNFSGAFHGGDGPVTIRRFSRNQWPPFTQAVAKAIAARGFREIADLNAEFGDGYGALPMSSTQAGRVSSSMAYLTAEVRARPNLRIETSRHVNRLIVENRRVLGVEAGFGDDAISWKANEVVVCAGGLHSPALLLRSGIGPADELTQAGVALAADRPGVGKNLSNHARVYVSAHLKREGRQPVSIRPLNHLQLRYSSGLAGCQPSDMQLVILNRTYWHRIGRSVAALGPTLYKPFSRGEVTLRSADPHEEPAVRFRHASDPRDLTRLVQGLRLAIDVFQDPTVAPLCNEIFIPRPSKWLRDMAWLSRVNALKSAVAAALLDHAGPLRPKMISLAGSSPESLPMGEAALADEVFKIVGHMFHPAGTCRLGDVHDKLAVCDSHCRVIGIGGLRVADASIMPTLPRSGTNIPCIMIGERAADSVKAGL